MHTSYLLLLVISIVYHVHCHDNSKGNTYNYYNVALPSSGCNDNHQQSENHQQDNHNDTPSPWTNCQTGERGPTGKAGPKVTVERICLQSYQYLMDISSP